MALFREKSDRVKTPALFPCAAKVKIPQLGSEETDFELKLSHKPAPTSVIFKSFQAPEPVHKSYLKRISADLSFSEDVVHDRCFHMVPYDRKYLYQALDPYDIVSPSPVAKIPPGRHDARGMDQRHMPCHLTKSYKPQLKPLKRKIMERAREMHKAVMAQSQETETEVSSEDSFFMTEVCGQPPDSAQKEVQKSVLKEKKQVKSMKDMSKKRSPRKTVSDQSSMNSERETQEAWEKFCRENYDWDAYTLSKVSSHMAKWVVLEKMPDGAERDRLKKLVEAWYGRQDSSDLLLESLGELKKEEPAQRKEEEEKKTVKKWKKPESTILARVYEMDLKEDISVPHAHDPYSDDSKAPFYRKPVGLRRAIKHAEKEEEVTNSAGAINATADITIDRRYEPPAPPTIHDFINPAVGDKFYDTANQFQQEVLTGAQEIHIQDSDKILLTSENKYQKKLQPQYPPNPETWYNEQDSTPPHEAKETPRIRKVEKGSRRWKELPQPTDDSAEFNMIPPGFDPEYHRSPDPTTRRLTKQNAALLQVIDEWRQKWHLSGQFEDSNPDDLIKDMADIQSHVRLKAIATIAKVAEYHPPAQDLSVYGEVPSLAPIQELPEKLFVALDCLLDDKVDRVKLAAAITLYSLNRPCEKARQCLQQALQSETSVDRWAAAQCLAHDGLCNSLVVGEIVRQLLETEDTIKHEKAIYLLGKLSIFSPLVHCMVAEQLNSSSWRHKVIACKILPTLHGTINKDVTNKLMDLMWNDWHEDVRKSAAQCLGKTSHGREVHDDLRDRIIKGNEATRLEAISKIGQLGIMTAKLLPVFLKCFEDEYISVRSEVCITCGNLEIKDEQVVEKLIHLATFDPIWKVKALAIQAMGRIGVVSEEITETLLWAVRYEEKEGVRAEACHTLMMLKLKTEEVADVLQERFLVESESIVRDEIASTLEMFGISATEDMDMVAQIKNEVRKLCTKSNIATQITINEADDRKHENLSRMIYENEKELKESEEEPPPMMERIRTMSQASDHSDLPHKKVIGERPHTPHQRAVSPAPSREVFTPTAEEELHQILSREDTRSEVATPEPRPTSDQQRESVTPREQGTPKGSEKSKVTTDDSDVTESSDREYSSGTGGKTPDTERPTSVVKFASALQVEEIPGRSTLTPSKSAMEDMRVSTRLSSMAGGRVSTDVRAFSRDAIKEREKINTEALRSYAGLDMRYYNMIEELIMVDNTYELMTGQKPPKLEVEKVQRITMIQSPSAAMIAQSDEAIPVDMEEDTEDVKPAITITVTTDDSSVKSG
uniref:HEAT repeat-containing protein 4-like isoform X1 n=1 Tax=Crassostrea virginica TaxID=6565 RepID=A0A8B8ERF6_CRAVI|nr:HEAT repeat-containing protein 4-like isoform X1 [Crassostrea virginica]